MTIKEKLKRKIVLFLTKQKPILVYTNGKEYIGLEEYEDNNTKYMRYTVVNYVGDAYNFNGLIYKIFTRKLIKTLHDIKGVNSDWYFTKIQLVRKKQ